MKISYILYKHLRACDIHIPLSGNITTKEFEDIIQGSLKEPNRDKSRGIINLGVVYEDSDSAVAIHISYMERKYGYSIDLQQFNPAEILKNLMSNDNIIRQMTAKILYDACKNYKNR